MKLVMTKSLLICNDFTNNSMLLTLCCSMPYALCPMLFADCKLKTEN